MEAGDSKEPGDQTQDGGMLQAAVQGKTIVWAQMSPYVPKTTAEGLSLKASSGGEVVRYERDLFLALANYYYAETVKVGT